MSAYAPAGRTWLPRWRRRRRVFQVVGIAVFLLICYQIWGNREGDSASEREEWRELVGADGAHQSVPCWKLPGADDTVIILRTGATEMDKRLPVHLATTLQCSPHHLIFSDVSDEFQGKTVLDALESISPEIKESHRDFELYRRMREQGHNMISFGNIGRTWSHESKTGHEDNAGWKLDKWKFLPMVNRTLHEYPKMKWYVFMEADSYISWPVLLAYLRTLDHKKPYYAGDRLYIVTTPFAHGGAGFIVSQPALRLVVDYWRSHQAELEKTIDGHWAGDCVLGMAFTDAGVTVTNSWPIFQFDYPGIIPYFGTDGRYNPGSDERIWCNIAVSYHHMEPSMIQDFWDFEQQWLLHPEPRGKLLRHSDVFKQYIVPRMRQPRVDWDNECGREVGTPGSFETCRSWCEADGDCLQYSLDGDGRCRHYNLPRLGKAGEGIKSGWLLDRIENKMSAMAPCEHKR